MEHLVYCARRWSDGVGPTAEEDERDGQQDGGGGADGTGWRRDSASLRRSGSTIPRSQRRDLGHPALWRWLSILPSLDLQLLFGGRGEQGQVCPACAQRGFLLPPVPTSAQKPPQPRPGERGGGQADDQAPENGAAQVGVILHR